MWRIRVARRREMRPVAERKREYGKRSQQT
jgi:hypothetical protein